MPQPPSAQPHGFDIVQAIDRARAHCAAGHADQAEIACQQVLAVCPGQSDAMHLIGLMAYAYGNLDLATGHLRHACLAPRAPAVFFSDLAHCRRPGRPAKRQRVPAATIGQIGGGLICFDRSGRDALH